MQNYSNIQKFLHDFVLSKKIINKSLFELEKIIYLKNQDINNQSHVFITGLPRSGTTSLLNFLFSSDEYASLTYNNMPFIMSPNFSKLFHKKNITKKERVHGDGITYDFNSPEALDEIFFDNNEDFVKNELITNIFLILLASVLAGIFTFLTRQTIINVSRYVEFDLKNEIYRQYQRLSLNFYKVNHTGDLMNRISEDVAKVRMYVGPAFMYSINTITLLIIVIIYMYKQSPILTYYTLSPLPFLSFTIYKLSKLINKKSIVVQENLSDLSSFTQESFSGITLIKSYSIEKKNYEDFNSLSENCKKSQISLVKLQALFFPLMILLIGLSNLLVIYVGGIQYFEGKLDGIGTIAEFIIYVNMLTWPVASLGWISSIIQQAEASQKRINEFLKQKSEIVNPNNDEFNIIGNIEFKNVGFTYSDTGINALKNINFKLNKGDKLGIIGKTGSGKSTLLNLIVKLYKCR